MGRGSYRKKKGLTPAMVQILTVLCEGERHGLAIMDRILEMTDGEVRLGPGALYGTLDKLTDSQLIREVEPVEPDPDPRRRYYSVTSDGRLELSRELDRMRSTISAAEQAMGSSKRAVQ